MLKGSTKVDTQMSAKAKFTMKIFPIVFKFCGNGKNM